MYLSDFVKMLLVVAGFLVVVATTIFLLAALWAWQIGPRACAEYGEGMNVSTEFKFFQGCFVALPDGRMLPESIARDVLRQEYRVEVKK